nr:hypothetical protein [uncultured Desulfobacter sp.]
MSIITAIGTAVSGVADIVKKPLAEWQHRKTIKAQAETEVAKIEAQAKVANANAKLELAKKGQQITADWDTRAQESMKTSWKDEFLLLLLFLPVTGLFMAAFLPSEYGVAVQLRMIAAVETLEKFPLWYTVILLGIVAAVFGLRWLVGPLVNKMQENKKNKGESNV